MAAPTSSTTPSSRTATRGTRWTRQANTSPTARPSRPRRPLACGRSGTRTTPIFCSKPSPICTSPIAGFYEGLYENGNGFIPLQTANNNGIILAALLYKVQGPILQQVNTNTQVWDTALCGHRHARQQMPPEPDGRGGHLLRMRRTRSGWRLSSRLRNSSIAARCRPKASIAATECSTAGAQPAAARGAQVLPKSCPVPVTATMSGSQTRLVWFDANRVFAAMGVVLIHSSTDFGGQTLCRCRTRGTLVPGLPALDRRILRLRDVLHVLAVPDGDAGRQQDAHLRGRHRPRRPSACWCRLPSGSCSMPSSGCIKADAFGYAAYIWDQLGQVESWLGYFVLGKVQYHMHFLPTLFALFLFYPCDARRHALSVARAHAVLHARRDEQHARLRLGAGSRSGPAGLHHPRAQDPRLCRLRYGRLRDLRAVERRHPARRIAADPARRVLFRGPRLRRHPAVLRGGRADR